MRLFLQIALLAVAVALSQASRAAPDFQSGNFMLPHCQHYVTDNYRYEVWDGDCGGTVDTLRPASTVPHPRDDRAQPSMALQICAHAASSCNAMGKLGAPLTSESP